EERAPIEIGIMSNWPPLDYVDQGGRPAGIGVGYLRALNALLGDVLVARPAPFSENYELVRERRLAALMDITRTKDREPFFEFTMPYLAIPHLIVGRKDGVYFSSEDDLKGKTVALERGYYNIVIFRESYPEVKIREYASTSDALDAVARGEADAYAGNRAVAIYLMEKELLGNLKPQGRLDQPPVELAIGVRKDWPILAGILDKALKAIPAAERDAINARYITSIYEPWFKSGHFWLVVSASLGGVLLVGFLGILWNRSLKRMVEVKTKELKREMDDRIQAEESLSESEQRFSSIFEISSVGIGQVDARDGRIFDCNDRFCQILGRPCGELKGMRFTELTHPEDRERDWELFSRAVRGEVPYMNEKRYLRKDGSTVWVRVNAAFICDDSGSPVSTVAICEDITESRLAQEKVKEYSAKLEKMVEERTRELDSARAEMFAQAKLSAMGRMGAGLAHQLNSPLGGAVLLVDGLIDLLESDDEHREVLRHVRIALDNMHNIVERMLSLSMLPRRGKLSRTRIDFSRAIGSILDLALHDCTSRGIEIHRELAEGLPKIPARPGELDQVFLNLVNNAVDAMPDGGTLSVRACEVDGAVEVRVSDTGEGIPKENIDRIFEPFFTTRRARRGIGLGLSVVREIVERHGGTIAVESEVGKGTAFTVRVPVSGAVNDDTPSAG
nr:transporter substrate-binding domain-containing protein [bacterium]